MSQISDTELVYGATGERDRSACWQYSDNISDSNECLFEPDRELRHRLPCSSESSSRDADCPLHRSAARVQIIVSSDGRVCESEGAGHGERGNTDDAVEIAEDTSLETAGRRNIRGSVYFSLQRDVASTLDVCDDGAASLSQSNEAVFHIGYMSDGSCNEDSVKCPVCMVTFRAQYTGIQDNCDHTFCTACLQERAKTI
jgi:hypothetical protein